MRGHALYSTVSNTRTTISTTTTTIAAVAATTTTNGRYVNNPLITCITEQLTILFRLLQATTTTKIPSRCSFDFIIDFMKLLPSTNNETETIITKLSAWRWRRKGRPELHFRCTIYNYELFFIFKNLFRSSTRTTFHKLWMKISHLFMKCSVNSITGPWPSATGRCFHTSIYVFCAPAFCQCRFEK